MHIPALLLLYYSYTILCSYNTSVENKVKNLKIITKIYYLF